MKTTAKITRTTSNIKGFIFFVTLFGFTYFVSGQKIDDEKIKTKKFAPINSLTTEARNNIDPNFIVWYRDALNQPKDSIKNPEEKSIVGEIETPKEEMEIVPQDNNINKNNMPQNTYPPENRDFRKLVYSTGLYFGAGLAAFGILMLMPEDITNWSPSATNPENLAKNYKKNTGIGPIIDHDSPIINYITHPYSGSVYYMTARSAGFKPIESFGYSFVMSSMFWEYGIEAMAEIPSIQDLFFTPVIGSIMGETFFHAKKSILGNNSRVLNSKFLGTTALFLVDPFNTILDGCGYKQKSKVTADASISPVVLNSNVEWGINIKVNF